MDIDQYLVGGGGSAPSAIGVVTKEGIIKEIKSIKCEVGDNIIKCASKYFGKRMGYTPLSRIGRSDRDTDRNNRSSTIPE